MVKKDSESDDYYEGVKKFDCSFADFDAYMNDLDMEIESRFGPIGLGLWLGNGVACCKKPGAGLAAPKRICYGYQNGNGKPGFWPEVRFQGGALVRAADKGEPVG